MTFVVRGFWVALLSGVSFAAMALPAPQPVVGEFQFRGDVRPLQAIQNEKVVAMSEEGRKRLQLLREQGFSCRNTGRSIYKCVRIVPLDAIPTLVLQRVSEKNRGLVLSLGEPVADPSLIHNGESYREWAVYAPVSWKDRTYKEYRLQWVDGLIKLTLDQPNSSAYTSFVVEEGELLLFHTEILTDGPSWIQFHLQAVYSPAS